MSGSGKSTIEKMLEENGIKRIISYTTRPMREGEVEGRDYYYVTEEEFNKLDLIENTEYRKWHYGMKKQDVDLSKSNCVCVIEPHGYRQIKNAIGNDAIGILLKVNDRDRLIRVLQRELEPDIEEIWRRFNSDKNLFYGMDLEVDYIYNDMHSTKIANDIIKLAQKNKSYEQQKKEFFNRYA